MRRLHEAEEEAEETEEVSVVSKRSGKKKDDDVNDDDDFQQNNNNLFFFRAGAPSRENCAWRPRGTRRRKFCDGRDGRRVSSCYTPPQYTCRARARVLSLSLSLSLFRARRLRVVVVVVVVVVVYFLTTDALTFLRFSVCALSNEHAGTREAF